MTIREVHQNILIKQQVDVRQKGWQNLLCGTSFINQSNSLQWCVLPQAFETSWGLQLAGRTTDTDLVLNSCLCLPGSCLTPRGWGQAGRHHHTPILAQMRMSEMLPFIHSSFALCQREVLWEPPHPSRWKGAMPGIRLTFTLLAQTCWGCRRLPERKVRLGEIHRGPWKTPPTQPQCQVHLWLPRQGAPISMQAQRKEEAAF